MAVKNTLRIGIDARLAGKNHAGIGRYAENLIKQLLEISQTDRKQTVMFVLFFFDKQQAHEVLGEYINHPNLELVITAIKHYGLQEQTHLPKMYKQAHLDLLYVPHWNVPLRYAGPLVITVHDLLWHEHKGQGATTLKSWQYPLKYWAYRLISSQAIKKAKRIFVPTQTISQTVAKFYPTATKKVVVSKEGIAPLYEASLKQALPQEKRIKKQLVYTGSLYPHKNLKLVIQALRKLPKYKLLIVCARNLFQDQIQAFVSKYKVKKQVVFLGYIDDKKLIELYEQSMALVQPSLSEGFGLTGVEAMAAHTGVLASDIPVFREIYQDAAIFFDPHDPASFVESVKKLEASDRKTLLHKGKVVATQYSFSKMAQDIYQAITAL